MKRFSTKIVFGFFLALFAFIASASPAAAKCDGWAEPGSEHRNAGNGCVYSCSGDSWSGPSRCDGQGNGQFQGAAAKTPEEKANQARAVEQSMKDAEQVVAQQGAAATAAQAASTAQQRATEATRQQAMVEAQRQLEVDLAKRSGASAAEIAKIEADAKAAAAFVAAAQGTNRGQNIVGSGAVNAAAIAEAGYDPNGALGTGNVSVSGGSITGGVTRPAVSGGTGGGGAESSIVYTGAGSCDVNGGGENLAAGSPCCRGGKVECGGSGVCSGPGLGWPGVCAVGGGVTDTRLVCSMKACNRESCNGMSSSVIEGFNSCMAESGAATLGVGRGAIDECKARACGYPSCSLITAAQQSTYNTCIGNKSSDTVRTSCSQQVCNADSCSGLSAAQVGRFNSCLQTGVAPSLTSTVPTTNGVGASVLSDCRMQACNLSSASQTCVMSDEQRATYNRCIGTNSSNPVRESCGVQVCGSTSCNGLDSVDVARFNTCLTTGRAPSRTGLDPISPNSRPVATNATSPSSASQTTVNTGVGTQVLSTCLQQACGGNGTCSMNATQRETYNRCIGTNSNNETRDACGRQVCGSAKCTGLAQEDVDRFNTCLATGTAPAAVTRSLPTCPAQTVPNAGNNRTQCNLARGGTAYACTAPFTPRNGDCVDTGAAAPVVNNIAPSTYCPAQTVPNAGDNRTQCNLTRGGTAYACNPPFTPRNGDCVNTTETAPAVAGVSQSVQTSCNSSSCGSDNNCTTDAERQALASCLGRSASEPLRASCTDQICPNSGGCTNLSQADLTRFSQCLSTGRDPAVVATNATSPNSTTSSLPTCPAQTVARAGDHRTECSLARGGTAYRCTSPATIVNGECVLPSTSAQAAPSACCSVRYIDGRTTETNSTKVPNECVYPDYAGVCNGRRLPPRTVVAGTPTCTYEKTTYCLGIGQQCTPSEDGGVCSGTVTTHSCHGPSVPSGTSNSHECRDLASGTTQFECDLNTTRTQSASGTITCSYLANVTEGYISQYVDQNCPGQVPVYERGAYRCPGEAVSVGGQCSSPHGQRVSGTLNLFCCDGRVRDGQCSAAANYWFASPAYLPDGSWCTDGWTGSCQQCLSGSSFEEDGKRYCGSAATTRITPELDPNTCSRAEKLQGQSCCPGYVENRPYSGATFTLCQRTNTGRTVDTAVAGVELVSSFLGGIESCGSRPTVARGSGNSTACSSGLSLSLRSVCNAGFDVYNGQCVNSAYFVETTTPRFCQVQLSNGNTATETQHTGQAATNCQNSSCGNYPSYSGVCSSRYSQPAVARSYCSTAKASECTAQGQICVPNAEGGVCQTTTRPINPPEGVPLTTTLCNLGGARDHASQCGENAQGNPVYRCDFGSAQQDPVTLRYVCPDREGNYSMSQSPTVDVATPVIPTEVPVIDTGTSVQPVVVNPPVPARVTGYVCGSFYRVCANTNRENLCYPCGGEGQPLCGGLYGAQPLPGYEVSETASNCGR